MKSFEINKYSLKLLSHPQQDKIKKHLSLVLSINESLNLTRITSEDEANILHIEDSLVAIPEINLAPAGLYGDLGTGAGYPGIPLSITTGRTTILVDSVQKKTAALNRIIQELQLEEQISTYAGRIEDLGKEKPSEFSVLTARALTSLPSLLELASPLLKMGGYLISYKAQLDEEELNRATALKEKMGMELISDRRVLLSDEITTRRIICFKKVSQATVSLPRRLGMAQKKPYI